MAKLSKKIHTRLVEVSNRVEHFAGIITRHQANDPSLPTWFSDKPVSYYQGLLFGAYTQIEDILHDNNAYTGFGFLPGFDMDQDFRSYFFK